MKGEEIKLIVETAVSIAETEIGVATRATGPLTDDVLNQCIIVVYREYNRYVDDRSNGGGMQFQIRLFAMQHLIYEYRRRQRERKLTEASKGN